MNIKNEDKTQTQIDHLQQLKKWSEIYQINLQIWGDQNNIYIYKNNVELFSYGGGITVEETIEKGLEYLERINQVKK